MDAKYDRKNDWKKIKKISVWDGFGKGFGEVWEGLEDIKVR